MQLQRHIPVFLSAALLVFVTSGCQQIGKGGRTLTEDAAVTLENTQEALEGLLYYKPEAEEYKPIPYTFCYQTQADINCYNQPLPDARGRLVGWQGRGDFNIEDTSRLPAKTALVRQPRKAQTRSVVNQVLEPEEEVKEAPQLVSLEPVFIPEAPKAKEEKTVTIKVSEPDADTLY